MDEVFKDVLGFEEYFKVSNTGKVFSKRTNKILKLHLNKQGYVTLSTKIGGRNGTSHCLRLHRIIAEVFIPNTENKPEVNHIDGIKNNNSISNLEWVTHSENTQHSYDIGLRKRDIGLNSSRAIFNREDILRIRESKLTNIALAIEYNVVATTISRIKRRITYSDV